jgi:tetratricopeptide (TPR) repeat protein/nucleoside phosphorylase
VREFQVVNQQPVSDNAAVADRKQPKYVIQNDIAIVKAQLPSTRLILFVTATDIEKECLHQVILDFSGEQNQITCCSSGNNYYYVGCIGRYGVVHVPCDKQGSISGAGVINTTGEAIDAWQPDAAIMVGIGFGRDEKKHNIGDVLVSEAVFNYEKAKRGKNVTIPRSTAPECGQLLLNKFKNTPSWSFQLEDGGTAQKLFGLMVSGEKVVDNESFKAELFRGYTQEAVGGDMESFGFGTTALRKNLQQWIVVKGICDWGDGNKADDEDKHQHLAADSAVSLCVKVLEDGGLDDLPRNSNRVVAIPEETAVIRATAAHQAGDPTSPAPATPINNLPDRNFNFAGRDSEMEQVDATLKSGRRAVLTGSGGYGKTQIALEYAYRHLQDYQYIWWVNAESELVLQNSYREFAVESGLGSALEIEFDQVERYMAHWFASNTNWLLIFDNTEDVQELGRYLPGGTAAGQVLITTKNTQQANLGVEITADVFTLKDSSKFLAARLKGSGVAFDADEADRLSDQLGHLPLALEQAAAYIIRLNYDSIADYSELFERTGVGLFEGSPDEKTVLTTWKISFDQIKSTAARQLFYICAYLAPDDIPLQLLIDGREALPEELAVVLGSTEAEQNNLILELSRYSLITPQHTSRGSMLSIHRLTQQVVRRELAAEPEWLKSTIQVTSAGFKYEIGSTETAATFREQLPHALAVAGHADSAFTGEDLRRWLITSLFNNAGYGLFALGDYPQALEWFGKALAVREEVLGTEHPDTATTYNNIGGVYHDQSSYAEALEWYGKALAVFEAVLGTEHPDTATTYNNIGGVYLDQSDYAEALEWFGKALAVRDEVLGTGHPDTATTYNNIAAVYHAQGDYAEALEWYGKALSVFEAVLGPDHPRTRLARNNIDLTRSKLSQPLESPINP